MIKLSPITNRLIVASLGLIAIGTVVGWATGKIKSDDAMLIILPTITGFFGLLRGGE